MCGKKHWREQSETDTRVYDGQTQRLQAGKRGRGFADTSYRTFPWWTLWLIWPLISLMKGVWFMLANSWNSLSVFVVPVNIVAALVLIAVGATLVLRRRQ